MEYKSIKPKKIYEEVSEAILTMIKNGTLKPGDKLLPVHQLAEQFQVGRSAVREALSALRAMGLIEMKQGEGTYVKNFDSSSLTKSLNHTLLMKKEDILNLLEVRKVLEVGAVRAAAAKRTEDNLQNMRHWLDEMEKGIGDEKAGEKADFHFHMAIAEASHNKILLELMNHVSEMIAETIGESRRIILYGEQTTAERLLEEHQAIYEAVLGQDIDSAQQAMLNHLTNVEHIVTGKKI
ncbi:FadR family transcriptional regulator [Bacillus cytotoxicus]|nr:FadR family transcriptional regulator [Bacillus cytotoxicus]AWC32037.1 FadR family transcriptional regulator [Bacillus cytotoxicus]AWC36067.1 FadR family transcriptional regulator [Bacillus cytotoxicus]AWC40621.1 FadR family transcriptional regulator [Bacillus cytotoxicus]AWC44065.1 FadR family transcriptional regulator [Bacillus cytotoxicus]